MTSSGSRRAEPVFLDALAGPSGTHEPATDSRVPHVFPDATAAVQLTKPAPPVFPASFAALAPVYPADLHLPEPVPGVSVSAPIQVFPSPGPVHFPGPPGPQHLPAPPSQQFPPTFPAAPPAVYQLPAAPLKLEWLDMAQLYGPTAGPPPAAGAPPVAGPPQLAPGRLAPQFAPGQFVPGQLAPGQFAPGQPTNRQLQPSMSDHEMRHGYPLAPPLARQRSPHVPTPPVVDPSAAQRPSQKKGSSFLALLFVIVIVLAFTDLGDEVMDWLKTVVDKFGE